LKIYNVPEARNQILSKTFDITLSKSLFIEIVRALNHIFSLLSNWTQIDHTVLLSFLKIGCKFSVKTFV